MKSLFATFILVLAASARAETIEADLCVYEATPGGIALAVRAAREGLSVVLVNHNDHLGGILSNGLGVWDTLWEGKRAPIYDEARQAIFDHYRTTYGENSKQYRDALPGKSGHTHLHELLVLGQVRKDALDRDIILEPLHRLRHATEHLGHTTVVETLGDRVAVAHPRREK